MVSAGSGKGSEVVPWLTAGRRDPGHVRVRGASPLRPVYARPTSTIAKAPAKAFT